MRSPAPLLLLCVLLPLLPLEAAAPNAGDTAWNELRIANALPDLPVEWQKTPPTDPSVVQKKLMAETERLLGIAEKARDFIKRYPTDPRRQLVARLGAQALASAEKLGSPTAREQLATFDQERLSDPQLPAGERLTIRMRQLQTETEPLVNSKPEEARNKYEAGARELIKEFPGEAGPWAMLMEVVDQGNDLGTRMKLKEIAEGAGPAPVKARAAAVLRRYDALGKPLPLKFTALDGREIDLEKLRGKVVLIQFWATWCDSCLESMAGLSRAYSTLQELGVEILGINLDTNKQKVQTLLKEKNFPWPQSFEETPGGPRIARDLGVTTLPSLWIVDKGGILRDLNGQDDLSKKIEAINKEASGAKVE